MVDIGIGFQVRSLVQGVAIGVYPITSIQFHGGSSSSWITVCNGSDPCAHVYNVSEAGQHLLSYRAVNSLGNADPYPRSFSFAARRCLDRQVSHLNDSSGVVSCTDCPVGGDCNSAIVRPWQVVAAAGFWAHDQCARFYPCPRALACLGGDIQAGVRARCAPGYEGVMCSICAAGYFPQFGSCLKCSDSQGVSWLITGAILVVVCATAALLIVSEQRFPGQLPRSLWHSCRSQQPALQRLSLHGQYHSLRWSLG